MTRCLCVLAIVLMPVAAGAQARQPYAGLLLTEALRLLQARGLRIVFSSETVTPAMRVVAEPQAAHDRARLDEILRPHGLRVRAGPGGTLVVVRTVARPRAAPASRTTVPSSDRPPPEPQYREQVTVEGWLGTRAEPGAVFRTALAQREIRSFGSALTDDPLRAAHALPHVAAPDDFGSNLSVRGSAYRHVGVVIDGVATRRLLHTAYARGEAGSLSMLHSGLVERITLRSGAYEQQFGATLGGQLTLDVREGSRERQRVDVALNASSATAIAEGPLGASARGSWLVSGRHSYRDWPTRGFAPFDGTMFGFTDALAKVAFDVRPEHHLTFSAIGGRSAIDELDGRPASSPGDGVNQAAVLNAALRSTFGSRSVLSQRVYLVAHSFLNKTEAGVSYSAGHEREVAYRADLAREAGRGVLQTGAQLQRLSSGDAVAWAGAAYAQYRWRPAARAILTPGLRVDRSTLTGGYPVGRWLLGQFALARGWTLMASTGVSHQLPQLEYVSRRADASPLVPERAVSADVGVARTFGARWRWQGTVYLRRERDLLRQPQAAGESWRNAFEGSARGVEMMVERRHATGLWGWAAYSFGKARWTDVASGEMFWADFDQRHAVNIHAAYRPSNRSSVAATFRSGTNFPIPAALEARDGALFAGGRRNAIRLPPHARLDLRATRSFEPGGRRLTLFVELLNVLNRTNVGLANGTIGSSGEAIGFTGRLMPRLPSAGIAIEF